LSAVLVVEHVDAFATVDLDDARQLGPIHPSELDSGILRLTLAHGHHRGRDSAGVPKRARQELQVLLAYARSLATGLAVLISPERKKVPTVRLKRDPGALAA
jgi:hypothetical protein